MYLFEAFSLKLDGRRAVELSCRINDKDRRLMRVILVEVRRWSNDGPLPFAYQWIEGSLERPYPSIYIVAAPGVSIQLVNFPDTYIPGLDGIPLVEIVRVQDIELVPLIGEEIDLGRFLGESIENSDHLFNIISGKGMTDPKLFGLIRTPEGAQIHHFYSGEILDITVPQLSNKKGEYIDSYARFAFQFYPDGELGSMDKPLLRIVKTESVRITVRGGVNRFRVADEIERYGMNIVKPYSIVYGVQEVEEVPPIGADLVPMENWRPLTRLERIPPESESLEEAIYAGAIDMTIGFVPIVGDLVDIAEFIYGVASGEDKWGNKLTSFDLAVMGLVAILPFVPSGLRHGSLLLRRFATQADAAERALIGVVGAGITSSEIGIILTAEGLIKSGRKLTSEIIGQINKLLLRMKSRQLVLKDLINATGTGFSHSQLQEYYRAYQASNRNPVSPDEWARRVTTGRPKVILEGMLGVDYRKRMSETASKFLNWSSVPRPLGFTDDQMRKYSAKLAGSREMLFERLESWLEQRRAINPILRYMYSDRIEQGLYRILKGNAAQILSMPIQMTRLQHLSVKYPGVKLVVGVQVRIMEEGKLSKAVLFSDNLISTFPGGDMSLKAVCEVKGGFKGGYEARVQVFEWIERRLTPGSQLILPRGSMLISPSGKKEILTKERVYVYAPGMAVYAPGAGGGFIANLARAPRYIITAKGTSSIGINTSMRTTAPVDPIELDITSEQLDFTLAKNILDLASI
jgi:hypothetical protein